MRCSKCGIDNAAGSRFCNQCATPLSRACPKCAHPNAPDARFCAECAAALSSDASKSSARTSSTSSVRIASESSDPDIAEGERKTVTALFADIKGSTELEQDLDPEEARAIVDPALKLMINEVRRYDGYVVQSTGDGIFALFGAPLAHEDHPQRALYAALRMQEELRRYSAKLVAEGGNPLQCRVGITTGEVVVRSITTGESKTEYTPIGHTTNLASRMQAVAPVGSIAITEATRKLCEGYFVLKPLGPTKVKGVSEPVDVFEVTGLGPLRTRLQRSAGRGLTKFVGRQREMDAMKAAAEQAKAGHGQIVAAMAEPGVGKSRLIFEFKAVSQSGWMVLEAFSVSHGKASAYLPVIDLLHGYFKIAGNDDARARREKVAGKIVILDPTLNDALPYLYSLLGIAVEPDPLAQMDAQARKRRTLEAIKRILIRESLNQPLMVIFEDLHWIDDETQAFLNLLADSIGTAKVLLLVNYRPEYSHGSGSKTYYTQLRLDPLGKESAGEMLSSLLGNGKDLVALKQLIIEKTEGNPFFMEETVEVLLDDGALIRNGSIKLVKPLAELKIPPTVQAILASRIDRLPPDQKDLLQTLAVIGREFPFGLVKSAVAKPDDELNRMLQALQLAEFIYEQPAAGDIEYTFKHALTQEVAYQSVLKERRRMLHGRIGAALESTYADSLDDHVAELARHFSHSGNPAKGAEYCLRAVRLSVERGSFGNAVAQFEAGLGILQKLPDDDRRAELELDLRNAASDAFITIKGYNSREAEQLFARAFELSQRPGINWVKSWSALWGVLILHLTRFEFRKTVELGAELVAWTKEHGDTARVAEAESRLALARMYSGEFEPAAESFERARVLLDSIAKPSSGPKQLSRSLATEALNRAWSGENLWYLGYPDRGLQAVNIATAMATESRSKFVLAEVDFYAARLHEVRREPEQMRERAEASLALSDEIGDPFFRNLSDNSLGAADAMAGDLEGGIARMRNGRPMDSAGALGRLGRFDEGLRMIDTSFSFIARNGYRISESETHRVKGELLLMQDVSSAAQAEQSFLTAIEIARLQKAKSWELRATTSLARLLAKQGKRDEARAMLADIYNWFTEGFDTADLKDAKALLDELGR